MKEKEILKVNAKHYEGLEIREDANCILKITNYNLKYCDIRGQVFKEIALKDIVNAGVISDKHIVEKNKSAIGRGVAGGLLFGNVGLVLGGLSGTGKKQIKEDVQYIIVNYKENGEDKVISVYVNGAFSGSKFVKCLNSVVNLSKGDLKCPKCGKELSISDIKCPNCKIIINEKAYKRLNVLGYVFLGIIIFVIIILVIAVLNSGKNIDYSNKIKSEMNISEEQADNIYNILNKVGIDKFDSIKADSESLDGFEGYGSKGYRIKSNDIDNIIIYLDSNNNVICIRYADKDYYRNGQILNKFE